MSSLATAGVMCIAGILPALLICALAIAYAPKSRRSQLWKGVSVRLLMPALIFGFLLVLFLEWCQIYPDVS
jgi:hypothetical protein